MSRRTSQPTRRPRAEQGEGSRLKAEIVQAAIDLLTSTKSLDQITMRAVARAVGIAAPSIYLHFADRDELIIATLIEANDRFAHALESADPGPRFGAKKRLHAVGMAVVAFATEQAGCYQILFSGLLPGELIGLDMHAELPSSFAVLYRVAAAAHGNPPVVAANSVDAESMRLALRLWAPLHGYITLRVNMPGFPWPPPGEVIDNLVEILP
jgi:AcrR family transcriptional regulator